MEGKAPKKKVEMGRWRARYLRRRWRWGGGGMLKQLGLERGKQLLIYSGC